jgi:hypothetical protein
MCLVKRYILCTDPSQLWFLWMLFGVFAIIWPFRKVVIERPVLGWVIAIVFYCIGIFGERFLPNIFCIWTACRYITFFVVGMRIRVKSETQQKLFTEMVPLYCWVIADLVLFAGRVFASRHSGMFWNIISGGLNFFLHMAGAIMAWTVLQKLADCIHWQDSKLFKILSSYSMPIYLFHMQLIYFTLSVLNGVVNPWLNAGINFIVAMIGSFVISVVLTRWKVTRVLIGERA